jgi:hypothetical protein
MLHKKSQTLAEVMKINERTPPKNAELEQDKAWNRWSELCSILLAQLVKDFGYKAVNRKAYEIANPKNKVQITKIKFPTQK